MRIHKVKNSYPSTILIPEELIPLLTSCMQKQTLRQYLHHLLTKKIPIPASSKWKTHYQSKGQKLKRFNFRPDEQDWQKLSSLSMGTGYSRCLLFVLMMLAEQNGDPTPEIQNIRMNFVFIDKKNRFIERKTYDGNKNRIRLGIFWLFMKF
jgi:hypothetical protein